MALLPPCHTSKAVLILGCRDEKGVMRFPENNDDYPGILLNANAGQSINEQMMAAVQSLVGASGVSIDIDQEYFEERREIDVTFYVGTSGEGADPKWATLAAVLRRMANTRFRLVYVKAVQVLAGSAKEGVKAVNIEDLLPH